MSTEPTSPGYSHTQKAPLCLILYGSALACVGLTLVIGRYGVAGIMGIFCLLALAGWHSTEPQEQ